MPPLLSLPLALLIMLPAWADDTPRMSTESTEYCEELAARLAARLAASPPSMADLSRNLGEDGRRLCASGHVRTGIAKLRRALRASRVETRGP